MKIVYCIPQLYNSAGMERILIEKINWLSLNGHKIFVITTDGKGHTPFFQIDDSVEQIELGINYCDDYSLNPLSRRIVTKRKKSLHRKKLQEELSRINPDITVSTFFEEAEFLYKLRNTGGTVLEYHFVRNIHKLNPRKGLIRKWIDYFRDKRNGSISKRYDRFVVLTEGDKKDWGNYKNISVIPNFLPSSSLGNSATREKKIIACGRLKPEKGFNRLIEAWSLISKKYSDWSLDIYGEGVEREYLESLIKELNIGNNTFLPGSVKDIEEKMAKASICAVSSLYEGFSIVIVEAFRAGLPVVAFSVDHGPKSLIENDVTGILIPNGDLQEFSKGLERLIIDSELRRKMGQQAIEKSKQFEKEEVMLQWQQMFQQLRKKKSN